MNMLVAALELYSSFSQEAEGIRNRDINNGNMMIPPLPSKEPIKPKRCLTSFNIFFQQERRRLLESLGSPTIAKGHGKIGFADLAKTISRKWKATAPEERKVYEAMAAQDKIRYNNEMKQYKHLLKIHAKRLQEYLSMTNTTTGGGAPEGTLPPPASVDDESSPKQNKKSNMTALKQAPKAAAATAAQPYLPTRPGSTMVSPIVDTALLQRQKHHQHSRSFEATAVPLKPAPKLPEAARLPTTTAAKMPTTTSGTSTTATKSSSSWQHILSPRFKGPPINSLLKMIPIGITALPPSGNLSNNASGFGEKGTTALPAITPSTSPLSLSMAGSSPPGADDLEAMQSLLSLPDILDEVLLFCQQESAGAPGGGDILTRPTEEKDAARLEVMSEDDSTSMMVTTDEGEDEMVPMPSPIGFMACIGEPPSYESLRSTLGPQASEILKTAFLRRQHHGEN